ncbi:MAG: Ppx/GppA phosphatase family protein [Phycisphaerales bacterium]
MPSPARKPGSQTAQSRRAGASSGAALPTSMIEAKGKSRDAGITSVHAALANPVATSRDRRFGVIDIGSNSIRLLVVELDGSEKTSNSASASWRILREERAMTRLARGLSTTGLLSNDAMNESADAIANFVAIAAKFGASENRLRAFATAAVRDAANRESFLSLTQERAGIVIEVISGLEEAKLAFQSAARVFDLSKGDCAVVDIGGGSAEVIQSRKGVIFGSATMPLGAVRLTEMFGGAEAAAGERWHELREHSKRLIKENVRAVGSESASPRIFIGCGGTFSTLSMLVAAANGAAKSSAKQRENAPITRDQLRTLLDRLRSMPISERQRMPGLPSDRADIIVAGLTVADRLMKRLRVDQILTHTGGVREGMMLKTIADYDAIASYTTKPEAKRELRSKVSASHSLASVQALAKRCNEDPAHSNHVTHLSLALYDALATNKKFASLAKQWGCHSTDRSILEAAALLHDAGIMVEYCKHHKHSESIVRHATLEGWSDANRELIAQVCRYHRRSEPSERHEAFAKLSREQRSQVTRLAAVLRVADSLDRSHRQNVKAIQLRLDRETLWIDATTRDHAHDERRAVAKKGKLLEKLLGVSIRLICEPQAADIVIAPGATLSAHADPTHINMKKR